MIKHEFNFNNNEEGDLRTVSASVKNMVHETIEKAENLLLDVLSGTKEIIIKESSRYSYESGSIYWTIYKIVSYDGETFTEVVTEAEDVNGVEVKSFTETLNDDVPFDVVLENAASQLASERISGNRFLKK